MNRIPVLTVFILTLAAPAQGAWTQQHSIWGDGNT